MNLQTLKLNQIRENRYNPNEMSEQKFEALVESIRKLGFCQPLVVRPLPTDMDTDTVTDTVTVFEIVDGAHRFRALKAAGASEAECVVVEDSDGNAKLRNIAMNNIRGEMASLQLAQLIADIGVPAELISHTTGITESELAELAELLDSDPLSLLTAPLGCQGNIIVEFFITEEQRKIVTHALALAIERGAPDNDAAIVSICQEYIRDKSVS